MVLTLVVVTFVCSDRMTVVLATDDMIVRCNV